jgi:hypothetical protein
MSSLLIQSHADELLVQRMHEQKHSVSSNVVYYLPAVGCCAVVGAAS